MFFAPIYRRVFEVNSRYVDSSECVSVLVAGMAVTVKNEFFEGWSGRCETNLMTVGIGPALCLKSRDL